MFLLALGAVLVFAVEASISGIALGTVGVILMVAGAVALAAGLIVRGRGTEERVVREHGHVDGRR